MGNIGMPAGAVIDFTSSTLPQGYLLCDGSVVSRVTYARLFDVIGTTFGAGDGSTTFKLPDARGRASIGAGTGTGLSNRALGAVGGAETHQLTEAELPSHTHIQNSHNHGILTQDVHTGGSTWTLSRRNDWTNPPTVWSNSEQTTATNQNTGSGTAHNNMQPFLVCTKIIKF